MLDNRGGGDGSMWIVGGGIEAALTDRTVLALSYETTATYTDYHDDTFIANLTWNG